VNERVPPQDLQAEGAVLSAILGDPSALDRVGEIIRAEHFYSEANRRIFEAAKELVARGQPVDVATVASRLNDSQRLAQVGGTAYLAQLVDATPNVYNVQAHARSVYDKFRVRQMISECQRIVAEAHGPLDDVSAFLNRAEHSVYSVSNAELGRDEITLADCASQAYDQIAKAATDGRPLGPRTGLVRLDNMLGGLRPGKLTIVAANPGMGKSTLAMEMALGVAQLSKKPVVGAQVFSAEMETEELGERALARVGDVESTKFRGGMGNSEWHALLAAIKHLQDVPIFVSDSEEVSLERIIARVRRRMSEFIRIDENGQCTQKIGVIVVDYLQLMNTEERRNENRATVVGDLAKGLKQLAKRYGVHVIAISSLNKAADTRQDKRPLMGDLRESGAIQFHADNILLLHREAYFDHDCKEPDLVECNVAKQRGGPTGIVKLRFDMKRSRFEDYSRGDEWSRDGEEQTEGA
jgi:replicative DNA helicase